jgi:hypothetical protein
VEKEQNGRKSLRRLKPTVGCNGNKRIRKRYFSIILKLTTSTVILYFRLTHKLYGFIFIYISRVF